MEIARRGIFRAGVGAAAAYSAAGIVSPRQAKAEDHGQAPGFYRFNHGSFRITVFSDGNLFIPVQNLAVNKSENELFSELKRFGLSADAAAGQTNPVLIETADSKVLVDCGSGGNFQPSAGRLVQNLEAADIDPADIDILFITHAHPDHCWGILDDFDENRFANAELVMGQIEWDFWMAEGRVNEVPEAMQAFVVGAQRQIGAFEPDAVRLIDDGGEVAPGLTAMLTPGHTLGHLALQVAADGELLLCTGDCFNHWLLSLAHPDWHLGFDMDKPLAVQTRTNLFDRAASDNALLLGYHMPWPGLGKVVRDGSAYRWIQTPMVWG